MKRRGSRGGEPQTEAPTPAVMSSLSEVTLWVWQQMKVRRGGSSSCGTCRLVCHGGMDR